MAGRTLFDKLWEPHVIEALGDGIDLIRIDRHFLHDLSGPFSLKGLAELGLPVRCPELTFATPDHGVATEPGRSDGSTPASAKLLPALRRSCERLGIRLFDLDDERQGIVHVIGPELGLTLPGLTIVCGDSHTCTHGAFGALAWGIGNTEITQVLATQALILERPRTMRVRLEGELPAGVTAKDLILHLIARHGADGGTGHAIEFAGSAVRQLSMEGRMTLCNLAVEFGAKFGFVAPDATTLAYLEGRPFAPTGAALAAARDAWAELASDGDAAFDAEIALDVSDLRPQISWGTSPEHTVAVGEAVPSSPAKALEYMGLEADSPLVGTPVQHVFIGSCTNGRLSDIEAAAAIAKGRRVAAGVRAWVVPGSQAVKRAAEARGLDRVLRTAGFEWREPGCSMCIAMHGDQVPEGERCVSTSNRNFVGRQGPGARTHLASPATAAAAAIAGRIVDPRELEAP
ncbi:MAG: 3-isopropylmalate dehydratase large subunit [Proteobacteria bacterium]|nr:3-isopropylmalate dehydratase large subunit [Pseudomonadota bacterium]